jgi:GntR family transcriptional regulator
MMRRLHRRNGVPYLLGRFNLEHEHFKNGTPSRYPNQPTQPILHRIAHARLARSRQTMTIGMADMSVSSLLQIPLNTPVAQVRRIALDRAGTVIYVGEGIYRGDAIRLEMDLR